MKLKMVNKDAKYYQIDGIGLLLHIIAYYTVETVNA